MIETTCSCGAKFSVPEKLVNEPVTCDNCRCRVVPVSAEPLEEGSGEGDFDARLVVTEGPQFVGDHFFLGGVFEIPIGKLAENSIALPGEMVSRVHAKLNRLDFGPSRWSIEDNQSTNAVFANGSRATWQQLSGGDVVQTGDD